MVKISTVSSTYIFKYLNNRYPGEIAEPNLSHSLETHRSKKIYIVKFTRIHLKNVGLRLENLFRNKVLNWVLLSL